MECGQWCGRPSDRGRLKNRTESEWASTRKVKPIWILLKQETVSGNSMSWVICKSAPSSRQITTPVPHHSVFYRPDALPAAQPTVQQRQSTEGVQFINILTSSGHCNKHAKLSSSHRYGCAFQLVCKLKPLTEPASSFLDPLQNSYKKASCSLP